MESALVHHMAKHLFDARFSSVKEMATVIDVPYRTLLRLFRRENSSRDMQKIMNALAEYNMKNTPPETLFKRFLLIG